METCIPATIDVQSLHAFRECHDVQFLQGLEDVCINAVTAQSLVKQQVQVAVGLLDVFTKMTEVEIKCPGVDSCLRPVPAPENAVDADFIAFSTRIDAIS